MGTFRLNLESRPCVTKADEYGYDPEHGDFRTLLSESHRKHLSFYEEQFPNKLIYVA